MTVSQMDRGIRFTIFAAAIAVMPEATNAADILGNKSTTATLPVKDVVTLGLFETAGDRDWYRVRLTKGITYAIVIDAGAPLNAADPGIYASVRNSSGRVQASDIDDPDTVGGFTYTARYTGNHFVEYRHLAGVPLPTGYEARVSTDCPGTVETKCTLALGVERKSSFNYAQDMDWFKVQLLRSRTYTLVGSGDIGFFTSLRTASGVIVWDDFLDHSSRTFRPPADGVYFIATQGEDDFDYRYRLLLRTP